MKIGFAGVGEQTQVAMILATAVETAASNPGNPAVIAVAYADAACALAIDPWLIIGLAAGAGAAGVLLDTYTKTGQSLLSWLSSSELRRWVDSARKAHLLTAVAGSLATADVAAVRAADPDIIGIRGAGCEGGRNGRISESKVGDFHRTLSEILEKRVVGHFA
jgi:uncharacterized protein (UPF0264 family)